MGLTDLEIRNLKAKKSRFDVDDGRGFFLRVLPSGEKSWHVRYTIDGERKRMTLGRYPACRLKRPVRSTQRHL